MNTTPLTIETGPEDSKRVLVNLRMDTINTLSTALTQYAKLVPKDDPESQMIETAGFDVWGAIGSAAIGVSWPNADMLEMLVGMEERIEGAFRRHDINASQNFAGGDHGVAERLVKACAREGLIATHAKIAAAPSAAVIQAQASFLGQTGRPTPTNTMPPIAETKSEEPKRVLLNLRMDTIDTLCTALERYSPKNRVIGSAYDDLMGAVSSAELGLTWPNADVVEMMADLVERSEADISQGRVVDERQATAITNEALAATAAKLAARRARLS